MTSLGADFSWLAQDQEQRAPDETNLPAPPTVIGANPPASDKQWTNVEKIMLASLALNAIWFGVYAVRSSSHLSGGD